MPTGAGGHALAVQRIADSLACVRVGLSTQGDFRVSFPVPRCPFTAAQGGVASWSFMSRCGLRDRNGGAPSSYI